MGQWKRKSPKRLLVGACRVPAIACSARRLDDGVPAVLHGGDKFVFYVPVGKTDCKYIEILQLFIMLPFFIFVKSEKQ